MRFQVYLRTTGKGGETSLFSESISHRKEKGGRKKKRFVLIEDLFESATLATLSLTLSCLQSTLLDKVRRQLFFFYVVASILVGLFLGLAEPGEEGGDGFQGDAFARLLCRVFAGFPFVEGFLFNHVLVVQSVEEHQQQVCRDGTQRREISGSSTNRRIYKHIKVI